MHYSFEVISMNQVVGHVKDNKFSLERIQGRLGTLGYEVDGTNFKKRAKIEAVINELVPLIEEEGANVFTDLYLEEHTAPGHIIARYREGKVERYH